MKKGTTEGAAMTEFGFTPSAYGRTSDTKLIGGEHDHEHPESQRR
ncbi:hypothetical protein ACWHAM_05520 [Paenibacillus terrae]|uniref:Uncharacterized protein n=1 Tax=Paenibacillus terrae (strain HPL-003) TaxID=985665 RepID=G7VW47_PAETH|nr:hypothetical protein HPL003_10435 [Paenibacillus terrae HPL-003]